MVVVVRSRVYLHPQNCFMLSSCFFIFASKLWSPKHLSMWMYSHNGCIYRDLFLQPPSKVCQEYFLLLFCCHHSISRSPCGLEVNYTWIIDQLFTIFFNWLIVSEIQPGEWILRCIVDLRCCRSGRYICASFSKVVLLMGIGFVSSVLSGLCC